MHSVEKWTADENLSYEIKKEARSFITTGERTISIGIKPQYNFLFLFFGPN
jgi:hypothetical protein